MRAFFKLFAVAAALGMVPAAASAAGTTAPTAAAPVSPAPAPAATAPAQTAPADEATTNAARPAAPAATAPTPSIGQPDGRASLQEQVTPLGREAAWFHNVIVMPVITVISLFVLALLLWVIVRYRRGANPTPSRTSHNTTLEVVWTLVPVVILVVIALPSIDLIRDQYSPPRADVTIKAIGNQWYWEYEYPDHGIQLVSNMLPEEQARARGEPNQLAVDERIVVPVGVTVKMIVTSNDVVHAWGVPALWTKIDAVPGRLNETWFHADRTGVFYGVCYELCGARHGYMPIAVEVVTPERFAAWVASRGGTMPGARPAPAAGPTVSAGEATEATPAPSNIVQGATPQQAPALSRESTQTE